MRGPSRRRSLSPWLFAIALLITTLTWSHEGEAVCQMAPPQDAIECFTDSSGICCVVLEHHGEDECYAAYCMEYHTCAWAVLLKPECK